MWDENTIRRVPYDYALLIIVVLLSGLGLTMVFSSSAVLAQEKFGDGLFFLKRMIVYTGFGFILMTGMMRLPYFYWQHVVYPFMILSLILCLLTISSDFGVNIGGARRWLKVGPVTFQPSELSKLALVLFMAYSLGKKKEKLEKFSVGVLPILCLTGLLIAFVLSGKDLGCAFVMGLMVLLMLYLGGARVKHLLFLFFTSIPILCYLITKEGYRVKRVLSFLNPWEDRYGSGFQIVQSLLAFNEGGIFGKGLGAGQQKLFYLPEAHTDFIFSVLGEELGFVGIFITISLFVFFVYRGMKIAFHAPSPFGKYLALGIVALMGVQSLLNMGVVMGLLPTKGLVLPLIGYGGSNLVVSLMAVGILLNISTYQKADTPAFFSKSNRASYVRGTKYGV